MKKSINRIVSLLLIVVLTLGICRQTNVFARRADFARTVESANEPEIEYGNYGEIEKEFFSKKETLDALIESAQLSGDREFSQSVKSIFTDFYNLLKDIITNGENEKNVPDAEKRFAEIFNNLFKLDTRLNEMDPKIMGELTNKGFVTAAISIVWDMVTVFDRNRVNSQTMEPGVTRLEDIPYIDDGTNEHMLDIFYPEKTEAPLPVIIDIHGGGLMMGDKDSNRVYASVLAKRGYTVVTLNYRLCPDVLYPSQVQDIMAAFKWVRQNADKYYIDLGKVYVTGDSAGGNLAYYVPLVESSKKLQQIYGVEPSGLSIDALGLVSGMYDMKNGVNSPLISSYLGFDYKNAECYNYLQPQEALPLGELPACYVVTCARDFLHSSASMFVDALAENGVEYEYRDWGLTVNKSSGHITSVAYPELEESKRTIDEMLAFFESHTK